MAVARKQHTPRAQAEEESSILGALKIFGPGIVTGASDDDPSGIATYSQVGARFGLEMLWTALLTFPLMAAVQEIVDRTALATGKGLGELLAKRFQKRWRPLLALLLVALIAANALNIAADLAAIGAGMHMLHAGPDWVWALVAGAGITALVISGSFEIISKVFKVLTISLLAYFVVAFLVHANWGRVLTATFVPHLHWNAQFLSLLVAVLGTTISPYLFFWQSAHQIEEMHEEPIGGRRVVPLHRRDEESARRKLTLSRADVFTGMALSNLVMWAIILTTGQTIGAHGHTNIQSAAQAAQALRPLAGGGASVLFALGFIGTGMLAVPVLAGAGAAGLAGLLRKSWGFSRNPRRAPVFYGLVAAGTITGTLLTLLQINVMKLLVIVALVNGLAAGPFLILVMIVSGDRKLMGEHRNRRVATTLGWTTTAIMCAGGIAVAFSGVH